MPKAIRKFPGPCDPRVMHGGPCFAYHNMAHEYPCAWKYLITVASAPAPYDIFNGEWVATFSDWTDVPGMFVEYKWVATLDTGEEILLYKWTSEPVPPAGPEVSWGCEFRNQVNPPFYAFGNGDTVPEPNYYDTLPTFYMTVHVPAWTEGIVTEPKPHFYQLP